MGEASESGCRPVDAPNWVDDIPDTDHIRYFKSFDWASTSLGHLDTWSLELRLFTLQLLSDPRPCAVFWTHEYITIYNEAYIPLAGQLHPGLMGKTFADAWPEASDDVHAHFKHAEESRQAVHVPEMSLLLSRNGFLEETCFNASFTPLRERTGKIAGSYNAVIEITRQQLNDRRRKMLNDVAQSVDSCSVGKIWNHIIDALATNRRDVPVALLYQVTEESETGNHRLTLRGNLGIPEDSKFAVQEANLDDKVGFVPLLCEAQKKYVTSKVVDDWGEIEWKGHGVPSKYVTAIPILSAGRLLAFLLTGSNPRRPIDPDHEAFMLDMSRQLSSTVSATLSIEESARRQQKLQDQLAESERQIRYMAQHSDIGMQHLSIDGRLIWANEHCYTIIGQRRPNMAQRVFLFQDQVLEEDYPNAEHAWKQVLQGQKAHTTELRMKRTYTPPTGTAVPATILLSAFPYMEDGKVKSVMSCMTEVSRLKWAESWQARLAQEAQEAKRQQSIYTDAISHEVRNPLSAILQLADSIASSTIPSAIEQLTIEDCVRSLTENVEAAQTILTCARHQKRIVDDVLTLSKMDFELMTLTPVAVQPSELVSDALKILDADSSSGGVEIHTTPEDAISDLGVSFVLCDPLRVTQILINLLSNAIKFTKREDRRDIFMRYGATLSNPRKSFPEDIKWAAPKRTVEDITLNQDWGTGEPLYLTFCISDTGPGMTPDEVQRLFNRFEQATPRTTIKYGGSGLGLFISHTLTEKQSGSIGVSSEKGKGSMFAFYIKTRRKTSDSPQPSFDAARRASTYVDDSSREPPPEMKRPELRKRISSTGPIQSGAPAKIESIKCSYHVLLVEDNLINQKVLKKQLVSKGGCVVHVANNGVEALELLRTTSRWVERSSQAVPIDIVLMDVEMPVMDGLTCTQEIRTLEKDGKLMNRVPIIAITANVRQEQVDKVLEAGMDSVVPKPFVVSELLTMIRKILGKE